MRELTLEEKIGQVFMFGFPRYDPEDAKEMIEQFKIGGIIYFARNCGTVEETAALSAQLQEFASSNGLSLPLFIAADQEGGVVARLTKGLPLMPGPMSLAAAALGNNNDRNSIVEKASQAIAFQLRSAGINVNLAPVLDVNDNPDNPVIGIRSFGENPAIVAEFGAQAVRGLERGGVLAVGKHFPGHGNTSVDSHLDLPLLPHSLERLNSCELVPFKAAIDSNIPAIMSAHILFPAYDNEKPATLSHNILQGLLREQLGFDGLIMTDCLEMNAISKYVGTAKGAVEAFKAGCDLLLISHTKEVQQQVWHRLLDAVKSGEITVDRLNQSVKRILSAKRRIARGLPSKEATDLSCQKLSDELHLKSITVERNQAKLIPLHQDQGKKLSLCLATTRQKQLLQVEDAVNVEQSSQDGPVTVPGRIMIESFSDLELTEVFIDDPHALEKCVSLADRVEAIIVLTRNADRDPVQAEFVRALTQKLSNVVFVAIRNPYDIRVAPDADSYICTYSDRPEAFKALAKILFGKAKATGKLPVSI